VKSQFQTISVAAREQGLGFLLIGGHAVSAHGYSRKTFDLDLLICRDDSKAWLEMMKELGFHVSMSRTLSSNSRHRTRPRLI
jgi:hypothetical protein